MGGGGLGVEVARDCVCVSCLLSEKDSGEMCVCNQVCEFSTAGRKLLGKVVCDCVNV